MVFGNRFICTEFWDLLPGIYGPSRPVVSHGSGLSRKVPLNGIKDKDFSKILVEEIVQSHQPLSSLWNSDLCLAFASYLSTFIKI